MRDSVALCTQFLVYLITHKKMKITGFFFLKKKVGVKRKPVHFLNTVQKQRKMRELNVSLLFPMETGSNDS